MFGGATPDGPLDELHAFDQARLVWTAQGQGSGASPPPQPRYEHLTFSVPAKGQFCVFAGAHAAGNFNDLHVYNVATASWEQPAVTGTAPSARTNPKGASENKTPPDIHVYIYCPLPHTDPFAESLISSTWSSVVYLFNPFQFYLLSSLSLSLFL